MGSSHIYFTRMAVGLGIEQPAAVSGSLNVVNSVLKMMAIILS